MEDNMKTVATTADRLVEALELRHINAAELSKLSDISKSTISYYLKGRFTPKQDKIYQLAQALRVSPSWLMGFDVDIDGTGNGNDVKESPAEYSPVLTSQQLIEKTISLCKILETHLPSSEDRKLLKQFHALASDNQALVMSMIEKLLLTQASTGKDKIHDEENGMA